jgi:hypothetical protein
MNHFHLIENKSNSHNNTSINELQISLVNQILHQDINEFHYELWQKILFCLFMFPIIFFSIAGNILVIIAISKYSYLRITNNIFLASLAVADLCVSILAMPLYCLQLLTGRWYLKSFMCRLWICCDILVSDLL